MPAASATDQERFTTGCVYIPQGFCDCNGNVEDALESAAVFAPLTKLWMAFVTTKTTVGELDACGICNGPGAIYDCGCDDIPQGFCDCDFNLLDALGVCGGPCEADADADGICDDVDPALEKSMSAAYVTDLAPSTSVGALTFHKASAIATLTNWTL